MEYFAYSQKEFVYKYVVMLSDTDQFKHMSFANYLRLMFLATDALLLPCFNSEFLSQKRIKLINSRMQFKRQTTVGDCTLIKVNSSEITGPRFSLLYTFLIEGSGDLVALGHQAYEVLNLSGEPPDELPDSLRTQIASILVNEEHLLYKY